jgi:hypothetical protein
LAANIARLLTAALRLGIVVRSSPMAAAIAGISKSLKLLRLFLLKIDPAHSKRQKRATSKAPRLWAAEAQQWVSAVMSRLRIEEDKVSRTA